MEELRTANKYQKKVRKKMCCVICVGLVVIIVLLVTILPNVGGGDSSGNRRRTFDASMEWAALDWAEEMEEAAASFFPRALLS